MLELKQVSFSYGAKQLFDNFSLALQEHQITTLIGPNGSGKSTLFRLLTRAIKPSAGEIVLDRQDIWQLPVKDFTKKVAIVHQQNQLYDQMKVIELIKMGRLPYHSLLGDEEDDNAQLQAIMQELEIGDLADKYMAQLSGGQQQRVWLATALAQKPEYLFLDEPTTYLDLHFQYRFLDLVKKLNREQNLTICMILHDLNQALQYSDQVILLNHGQIQKQGNPEEVITEALIEKNFGIKCQIAETQQGKYLLMSGTEAK